MFAKVAIYALIRKSDILKIRKPYFDKCMSDYYSILILKVCQGKEEQFDNLAREELSL